ncbi:uncharacterized protein LOC143029622 isoform X2 [Oratosquilla oratoria]|uniref:uncharacterized protein LOC143029622 isoform X2 n=1 Tax=Oratosquilla oratoria TaxID=337810 RepID=UPI003F76157D
MDFPAANQHQGVEKSGFLNKLSGRSFPYIPQWKRRYCVLSRGKLYYYEREDSKPGDKSTGVLNLEYFDQVAEAGPKECKKATNVFLLTSQDKSFFDPGRHLFSADTLTDMNDWVRKLQTALDNIRRNKRHLTSDHSAKGAPGAGGGNKKKDDNREEKENLSNSSKDRKKRKKEEDSKKKRKSQGVTSETQTREGDEDAPDGAIRPPREGGGGPPGGMVNLAGLGVRLGGGGSSSVVVDEEPKTRQQLENITKHRVKGPSGRRAPQNRRTVIAAKHRASSLSALEFESLNDNSAEGEAPWINRSLDALDDDNAVGRPPGAPRSQPALAYCYPSSDEGANEEGIRDDDDDDEPSITDSFSASCNPMPPPPPPRSASYGPVMPKDIEPPPPPPRTVSSAAPAASKDSTALRRSSQEALGSSGWLCNPAGGGGGGGGGVSGGSSFWGTSCESGFSLGDSAREDQRGFAQGSQGSLEALRESRSNRASPAMDHLENLLMNQSVVLGGEAEEGGGGGGGIDGNLSRSRLGLHKQHEQQQPQQKQQELQQTRRQQQTRISPDLNKFSVALRHLQRHVVDLDHSLQALRADVHRAVSETGGLRGIVDRTQDTVEKVVLRVEDVHGRAQKVEEQIAVAAKETTRIHQEARDALEVAREAMELQKKAKAEYEDLVAQLQATLKEAREEEAKRQARDKEDEEERQRRRSSFERMFEGRYSVSKEDVCETSASGTVSSKKVSGGSSRNLSRQTAVSGHHPGYSSKVSGGDPSDSSAYNSSGTNRSAPGVTHAPQRPLSSSSSSSSSAASANKQVGYQSLFSRPSSILSGLANRSSLTKSVSFADSREGEGEEDKKEVKGHENQERKTAKQDKEDKKHSSLEKKQKQKHTKREKKGSLERPKRSKEGVKKVKQDSGGNKLLSADEEDIPMMDEDEDDGGIEALSGRKSPRGLLQRPNKLSSSASITLSPPSSSPSYILGKSASTSSVPESPRSRPKTLGMNLEVRPDPAAEGRVSSLPGTPEDMPMNAWPDGPPSRGTQGDDSGMSLGSVSSSSLTGIHRPGSTPGPLVRQGSMTTVPEDMPLDDSYGPSNPPVSSKGHSRRGVYAITRQNSSPNIPLQRQNSSSPSFQFPLQRQHSLGIVPEEGGRLSRQSSLMSVPEDRRIVDRTLPLSPSSSMTYFPISPSSSTAALQAPDELQNGSLVSDLTRPRSLRTGATDARSAMELVTGPVLAGSSLQHAAVQFGLPADGEAAPAATSSLKKEHEKKKKSGTGVVV